MGGPGKLRSFWEQDVFVVKSCQDNNVVYEVENLARSSDIRVLHRNLLLPCGLMEDVPPDTTRPPKTPTRRVTRATQALREHQPEVSSSESESDEMYIPVPVQAGERPSQVVTAPPPITSVQTEQSPTTPVENLPGGHEPQAPSGVGASSDRSRELPLPAPERVEPRLPTDQRALRSRGQALSWNPTMGDSQVVTSDHEPTSTVGEGENGRPGEGTRVRRPPMVLTYSELGGVPTEIPLADNTGEIEVGTLAAPKALGSSSRPCQSAPALQCEEEPTGIRRLLTKCSHRLSDWFDALE